MNRIELALFVGVGDGRFGRQQLHRFAGVDGNLLAGMPSVVQLVQLTAVRCDVNTAGWVHV